MLTLSPQTGLPVALKTLLETLARDVPPSAKRRVTPLRAAEDIRAVFLSLAEIVHLYVFNVMKPHFCVHRKIYT